MRFDEGHLVLWHFLFLNLSPDSLDLHMEVAVLGDLEKEAQKLVQPIKSDVKAVADDPANSQMVRCTPFVRWLGHLLSFHR